MEMLSREDLSTKVRNKQNLLEGDGEEELLVAHSEVRNGLYLADAGRPRVPLLVHTRQLAY